MRKSFPYREYIPAVGVAVSLFVVYLLTMAPGLTWANESSDGGDLITAVAVGGVAHPTGYPVYLFISRLFQLLPVGTLAFRTNLLSAIAAILTSLMIYRLVSKLVAPGNGAKISGMVSALAFGLAPLIWSQAVVTEVYTLHALFVIAILYQSSDHLIMQHPGKWSNVLSGLVFGLGMGNHLTTVLLFPVLIFSVFPSEKGRLDWRAIFLRLLWMGIGLLAYISLPLRAASLPKLNWGNPVTLQNFIWLVSGKLYHRQIFDLSPQDIWLRIRSVADMLIDQFGIVGLVVGLFGLIVFYQPIRLYLNTIWTAFIFIFFAIGYATFDSYMYLMPVFLCFAIWIGIGVGGLADMLNHRYQKMGSVIGLLVLLSLFFQAGRHWSTVDASRDVRAEQFGKTVMLQAPVDAIVFAEGDKAIFTLWYFHYALHERQDLIVIATDLLHFDWYQESLQTNYPQLNLPVPFPFDSTVIAANPERPACQVEFIDEMKLSCQPAELP